MLHRNDAQPVPDELQAEAGDDRPRPAKAPRTYWLLQAEIPLPPGLFAVMVGRIAALPVPTRVAGGDDTAGIRRLGATQGREVFAKRNENTVFPLAKRTASQSTSLWLELY